MDAILNHQLRMFDRQIEQQENILNLENLGLKEKVNHFEKKPKKPHEENTEDLKKILIEANLPVEGPLKQRIIEKYDLKNSIHYKGKQVKFLMKSSKSAILNINRQKL